MLGITVAVAAIGQTIVNLKYDLERTAWQAGHSVICQRLKGLNVALEKYIEAFGDYPESLRQLSSPPMHEPAASTYQPFPFEGRYASSYFVLTYDSTQPVGSKHLGYEIHADPDKYPSLPHYYVDQTKVMRYDPERATAQSRWVDVIAAVTTN